MVGLNKRIMRVIVIAGYLLITLLIVSGISSVFVYLNTGADRSSILQSDIRKLEQYVPNIDWDVTSNKGREIDATTLSMIEDDYLDSWYVKILAFQTNTKTGIEDYFTKQARKNIYSLIDFNKENNIVVKSTSLEHHPKVNLFSEDGQLLVLTDEDVVEYKRIYKDDILISESKEKSTYKVVLFLEDGFWRIRHLVKEKSEFIESSTPPSLTNLEKLKGINYYPQDSPWDTFGDRFSAQVIDSDFKLIKEIGLNSIRIFIPYEDFGKANVKDIYLQRLTKLMDLAERHELKVVVTLFDFYGDYSVLDWTHTRQHAKNIVNHIKDHKALLNWDIKNEPDLDFESRGKETVLAWLSEMIHYVRTVDPNHGITIGWSRPKNALLFKENLDIITFHYYEDLANLSAAVQKLKKELGSKPLVMGEFGVSSYNGFWNPFGKSKKDQAEYHRTVQEIIKRENISFMSWTLYDFKKIPKEVVGKLPWRKNAQKRFGFIDINGKKKPAFQYIIH